MQYDLPYGIHVIVAEPLRERQARSSGSCGTVSSDLLRQLDERNASRKEGWRRQGYAAALESFLLELACAGVNIGSPEFLAALEATVRKLGLTAAER